MAEEVVDVSFVVLHPEATDKVVAQLREGVGLGWYERKSIHSVRLVGIQPSDLWRLAETIHSRIVLFHARRGTVGDAEVINTHPFTHGRFMFIHGGTLKDWRAVEEALLPQWRERLQGETDSERLFFFILQNLQGEVLSSLKQAVDKVKEITEYDYLNFILSDGEALYAFSSGERPLHFWKGRVEEELCCSSLVENIAVRSRGLVGKEAVVVSGQRFQMEGWKTLSGAFLKVDPSLQVEVV